MVTQLNHTPRDIMEPNGTVKAEIQNGKKKSHSNT